MRQWIAEQREIFNYNLAVARRWLAHQRGGAIDPEEGQVILADMLVGHIRQEKLSAVLRVIAVEEAEPASHEFCGWMSATQDQLAATIAEAQEILARREGENAS